MKNNFKFKHSLGQNFITDEFVLEDIACESGILSTDYVLEIGPGNGALTRCLLDKAKHVVAIEIDSSLMPLLKNNLKSYNNISIINADYLKFDFNNILNEFIKYGFDKNINHIKVVANLPYYITSPIIMSILFNPYIYEMTIMVQKEVAERIIALPGNKDYGILTLACNYFANTTCLFIVTKDCFYPQPKVDSAVVKFVKHKNFIDVSNDNNFHITDNIDYKNLFYIIKSAFSQRRKKLINSLINVGGFDKSKLLDAFSNLGIDELTRAENLSLSDYKNLSKFLNCHTENN